MHVGVVVFNVALVSVAAAFARIPFVADWYNGHTGVLTAGFLLLSIFPSLLVLGMTAKRRRNDLGEGDTSTSGDSSASFLMFAFEYLMLLFWPGID